MDELDEAEDDEVALSLGATTTTRERDAEDTRGGCAEADDERLDVVELGAEDEFPAALGLRAAGTDEPVAASDGCRLTDGLGAGTFLLLADADAEEAATPLRPAAGLLLAVPFLPFAAADDDDDLVAAAAALSAA